MKSISNATLKKYVLALKKMKRKYVSSELLSKEVGIYPEVINETISFFDPMVTLDYQYNLMDLLPQMEEYLGDSGVNKTKTTSKTKTYEPKVNQITLSDYIYQKLTIGGFLDRNRVFTDAELKEMKSLIIEEQKSRKGTTSKKKGRR